MLHIVHMIERRTGRRVLRPLLLAALLLLALGLLLLAPTARAQDPAAQAVAQQLLDLLDAGEFAQAEALFTPAMAQAVPAAQLQAVWTALPAQAGQSLGRGTPVVAAQGGGALVDVPLQYAKAQLVARIAVDADGRVAGLMIQPAAAAAPAPAPPAAADAAYDEREINVGDGARALPATLAMPKGAGPFPAVVLVHGSGPHDRDQTIGPNKPFLDIARGLAAQGIAVLRYEKRTKAHPQEFTGAFGIDQETTNDAVLAVDALRRMDGIDGKRVFVLGHSQGGMLAPRIAATSGHVAGLILLAAPARSLLDIVIEQNRRLAVLDDGKISDAERSAINALVDQVRLTRDAATPDSTRTVMGLPAGYWRSIEAVDPVADARAVGLPMLILQGARDIQVVDADWQRWRGAFHGNDKASFKLYETLNHLGIAGEGDGSLAEYNTPGHVDATLIDDVARWVKAR
jgi:alpha-beta hydrolase superfamily lysophospholipase